MGNLRIVASAAVVIATAAVGASPAASYAGRQGGGDRLGGVHRTDRNALRSPAPVRAASTGRALGLSSYSDIVADPDHGHVFISGGQGVNGVVVTNLAGKVLKTLGSTPGASGMTLSPDGDTLYVALASGDGIREIDTSTLSGTTVSTGAGTCPQEVAVTAGLVWFSYTCEDAQGAIGTLDPTTNAVHTAVATGFYYAPYLATSPALDGVLFTGLESLSPATVARYDVTGGATPSATLSTSREAGENLQDLVVTPDGKDLIVASGSPYYHQVYSTTDLANDGTYTTSSYPDAVAVNAKGQVAAGIDGIYSKDIWLYDAGAAKPFKTIAFADGDYLQPRGLAFTGQTVYAVTGDFGGPYFLHVESTKPNAPMKVTTSSHAYKYGAKARITVRVKSPGSARHVSVYATPATGRTKLVKAGALKKGAFSTTYRVQEQTVFTAVYAGGSKYDSTTKSHSVKVHAKLTSKPVHNYGRHGRYALFHKGKDPHWIATVAPRKAGGCVIMEAEEKAHGPWQTVPGSGLCVTLNAHSKADGVLYGTHVAGEVVRVRAFWSGDSYNLKAKTGWSYARFTN